jgi:hypothetical protein
MNMELKKSKSNKWNFFGKLFLTLTLVSMTIAYLIPLIGILFFYPIADLCLMALSAFIVARLPVAVILQPIIFTVIWIFLGLARDIPHVPALLFGNDAVVHSNVKIFRQVDVKVNSAISIEGDVNPVVAALGRSGVIRPRLHSSGMAFESLERANARSAVIDIPDEIWRRGFVPIIGGEAYPKVKIKVLDRLENFDIEIQVLSGQNEVAGIYKRSLSRPPKYPGDGESQIWYWIVNMLSNSLWRNLFDQTTDTNFNKEIANFLGDSLGKKLNTTWHGPFKTLKVTSDKVIEYSGGDSAPMHLYKIKSTLLKEADNAGGERHWEVCNVSSVPTFFRGEQAVWARNLILNSLELS